MGMRKDGEERVTKCREERARKEWEGEGEEGMGYTYQQMKMLLPPLAWYPWKHSIG